MTLLRCDPFWRRLIRALFLVILVLVMLAESYSPVAAVTQADIDSLKDEAATLDNERTELETQLDALSDNKAEILTRRKLLDSQIENTREQIANVEAQISEYETLIAQREKELAEAQAAEAEQYDLFCRRVRAMEEQGTISYWSVLFRAESFSDMLARLDMINEIMDADQRVIDKLVQLQHELQETKSALEQSKSGLEDSRSELTAKEKELDEQRQMANALVLEIQNNESEYKAALDDLDAEEEAIQAKIVQMSKELSAQQSTPTNPGGYIWPVDSRYITSTVGGRTSPGGIGSTDHKGTDIGRVGYTSQIYASKAGTVIVSQYSSSYGNYVVISHGSGNTTLYAHMSSHSVSTGQYVNQGDVIGITGSTGNSTGPHLHFEITENGERINPLLHGKEPCMGYLTGYTLAGSSVGS